MDVAYDGQDFIYVAALRGGLSRYRRSTGSVEVVEASMEGYRVAGGPDGLVLAYHRDGAWLFTTGSTVAVAVLDFPVGAWTAALRSESDIAVLDSQRRLWRSSAGD